MRKTSYLIALRTPIGVRKGRMDLQIHGKTASGVLHILSKSEPFLGFVDENGKCSFRGKLRTLMRSIPYQAVGRMTKDRIELSLVGDKESFHLSGEVCE